MFSVSDMIPHFIHEPKSAIVSRDSEVKLSCSVFPSTAEIRWKLNDKFIDNDDRLQDLKATDSDSPISYLLIPSLPEECRDCMFQCVADTPWGTIISRQANISLAGTGNSIELDFFCLLLNICFLSFLEHVHVN